MDQREINVLIICGGMALFPLVITILELIGRRKREREYWRKRLMP